MPMESHLLNRSPEDVLMFFAALKHRWQRQHRQLVNVQRVSTELVAKINVPTVVTLVIQLANVAMVVGAVKIINVCVKTDGRVIFVQT